MGRCMYVCMFGWTDGLVGGWMGCWVDGCGWMYGWVGDWMDGLPGGCMNGLVD